VAVNLLMEETGENYRPAASNVMYKDWWPSQCESSSGIIFIENKCLKWVSSGLNSNLVLKICWIMRDKGKPH
jgi:hypothetical protein